jgi:putative membrane protein insertion efficiency factor
MQYGGGVARRQCNHATQSEISLAPVPFARRAAHVGIRAYQLTLSALVGRQCRHLPSCSTFTDEAIQRHGLWIGGWMGAARICRCHPWGTSGFDPVPDAPNVDTPWYTPWRYARWR